MLVKFSTQDAPKELTLKAPTVKVIRELQSALDSIGTVLMQKKSFITDFFEKVLEKNPLAYERARDYALQKIEESHSFIENANDPDNTLTDADKKLWLEAVYISQYMQLQYNHVYFATLAETKVSPLDADVIKAGIEALKLAIDRRQLSTKELEELDSEEFWESQSSEEVATFIEQFRQRYS